MNFLDYFNVSIDGPAYKLAKLYPNNGYKHGKPKGRTTTKDDYRAKQNKITQRKKKK